MATLTLKKQFTPSVHIGKTTIIGLLCIFILTIASLHLLHSNKSATRAYVIRKLEVQKADLMSENQILRMQSARARSLSRLSDNVVVKDMVDVQSPVFVKAQ